LSGSLPVEVIQRIEAEARQKRLVIEHLRDEKVKRKEAYLFEKYLFGKWDTELDAGRYGPKWLFDPGIASLVCDAMHYRDGKDFILYAFCVMPNHVHLVCKPIGGAETSMSRIMQSLKGYTARKANGILKRQGDFWQHESYDHVVRDSEEYKRIVNYVLENPIKAGLPNRWVYCREEG
jgi:REP element-mobilizing transposase RayT